MPETDPRLDAASKLGAKEGKAAGTWFGGPDTDWVCVLAMIEDGDPEVWESYREPLSGEYADDRTPTTLYAEVVEMTGLPVEPFEDAVCAAYGTAHFDAWASEIERQARYQTAE